MRIRIVAFLLALSLAGSGLEALSHQTPQTPSPGAISGVIVDAVSGQPIAGARVSLSRTTGGSVGRTIADSRGRFVFPDLPPAPNYYLDAVTYGYASTRYGWSGPGQSLAINDILQVPVSAGQWVQNIKIPLWKYGSVAGRVIDERNEPVVGVLVRAYTLRPIAGRMRPVFGGLATTDDQGAYRMTGLHPGRYLIAVPSVQSTVLSTIREVPAERPVGTLASTGVGAGGPPAVSTPTLDAGGRHRLAVTNFATPPPPSAAGPRAYPITYYPGVTTAGDAQEVTVSYGDTHQELDIRLTPVPAARVSGRLDGFADKIPNMLLRLMPAGYETLGVGAEAATTTLDTDGTFTFLNVPAGDYTLLAQTTIVDLTTANVSTRPSDPPGFPGSRAGVGSRPGVPGLSYLSRRGEASDRWARVPVSVGAQPIDNLVVSLQPAATARGRIVFEAGTTPPDRIVYISATPADGDPALGELDGTVTKDADGFTFEMGGLKAGRYIITSGIFGRYGVMSTMARGQDVTYIGLDGALGRDIDDVVITLTSRVPVLKGSVSTPGGVSRAAVIVFPQNQERWRDYGWEPTWIGSQGTAADGSFTFDRLQEGDYFVAAVDPTLRQQWIDPAFLAKLSTVATRVSLKWGDSTSVALQVQEVK